jgi:predicted nucleic acid-binding protein
MDPTPFVLDNSVLCGWFLANQASPYSEAVSGLLSSVDAHAPWLLQLELTNVLRTACRRGTLTVAAAREIVDQVALLPIRIDPSPPPPPALLSLALRFQLTSSDAAYLELALRLQLPLATRDDELAQAAWAAGVGVLSPPLPPARD